DRGLNAERPVVVLSGNGLEHLEGAMGALYAGVPYAPISPAYSTLSKDFGKLRHIMQLLTPGMVFVDNVADYANAIRAVVPEDVEIVAVQGDAATLGRPVTL